MPLARYFLYVGGVLLLLLIMADACLPKLPKTESADALRPVIRIHSDRKWPERVVYDTNRATIIPAQPAPEANISARSSVADASVRAQEAFAQLQPSDAAPPPSTDAKKRQPGLQHQHKMTRKHAGPLMHMVARQPLFGWYGIRMW